MTVLNFSSILCFGILQIQMFSGVALGMPLVKFRMARWIAYLSFSSGSLPFVCFSVTIFSACAKMSPHCTCIIIILFFFADNISLIFNSMKPGKFEKIAEGQTPNQHYNTSKLVLMRLQDFGSLNLRSPSFLTSFMLSLETPPSGHLNRDPRLK